MLRVLSASLGVSGLADVGFRFYDANETAIAPRSGAGVKAGAPGWYSVSVDVPENAASVRWDSTSRPTATAVEYFDTLQSAIAGKTALIQSGAVRVVAPVSETGQALQLIAGDDYRAADGRALQFESEDWPDLTGATVVLKIGAASFTATAIAARKVRAELTKEQTAQLKGQQRHELEATLENGNTVTLLRGNATILAQL